VAEIGVSRTESTWARKLNNQSIGRSKSRLVKGARVAKSRWDRIGVSVHQDRELGNRRLGIASSEVAIERSREKSR
jgi:hypothetical protein